MNQKALKTLEFNKIIDMLTTYASTPLGKDMCKQLLPMDTLDDICSSQEETSHALTRIIKHGSISFTVACSRYLLRLNTYLEKVLLIKFKVIASDRITNNILTFLIIKIPLFFTF